MLYVYISIKTFVITLTLPPPPSPFPQIPLLSNSRYDMNNTESLKRLDYWFPELDKNLNPSCPRILIGRDTFGLNPVFNFF